MKKIELINADIANWENEVFNLYASQSWNDKRLVFLVGCFGVYKVKHGDDILYKGTSRHKATNAWKIA